LAKELSLSPIPLFVTRRLDRGKRLPLSLASFWQKLAAQHVVLTGDEANVSIEVKNSGPAIEKEILKQIFDPLKRGLGQGNRDDSGAGLGLGLYIVREVTQAHGGDVTVRSDNTETVFAVRLPRRN
jgi:signal transduction histidine kinase